MRTVPELTDMTSIPITGPGLLDWLRERLFTRVLLARAQTLFSLIDACTAGRGACGCAAHQSVGCPVGHAAIYRALREGVIDADELCRVVCEVGNAAGLPLVYAIDTTVIERPYAPTSADRQLLHGHGHSRFSHQVMKGWRYQVVARLTGSEDSWALPVSIERVGSEVDPVDVALDQISQVCAADGSTRRNPALFLCDSGYPSARLTYLIRERALPAEILVRVSTSQVFYTRPEELAKAPLGGRPRRHGQALHLSTLDLPACQAVSGLVGPYGQVTVKTWTYMHQKLSGTTRGFEHVTPTPVVEGTLIVADVAHLRPSRRRGKLCLFYSGDRSDLFGLLFTYLRRFDIEHLFRYWKTNAGIGNFHPTDAGTYTTWLQVHAAAYTQLLAARLLITHLRLPWETRPVRSLTPVMVSRQVSPSLSTAWQPPQRAKPGHSGPGSAQGSRRRRRQRFPVIRKHAKQRTKAA
jgi:hypothetical protein